MTPRQSASRYVFAVQRDRGVLAEDCGPCKLPAGWWWRSTQIGGRAERVINSVWKAVSAGAAYGQEADIRGRFLDERYRPRVFGGVGRAAPFREVDCDAAPGEESGHQQVRRDEVGAKVQRLSLYTVMPPSRQMARNVSFRMLCPRAVVPDRAQLLM